MSHIQSTDFKILNNGTCYLLPCYRVGKNGLSGTGESIAIEFVRGSTDPGENVPRSIGVLHEALIAMQIHDLRLKSKEVPSRETALAITKLEEALHWLQARQKRRRNEGTAGTHKQ